MKRMNLTGGLMALLMFFLPLSLSAQSYGSLWREVEELEKKDLPKSVIQTVDKIYRKARNERNAPQMMKAYLTRAEYRVGIAPDSLQAEMDGLREWALRETDPVARAVLNSVVAYYELDVPPVQADSALHYFRLSLKDGEALAAVKAEDYRPLVKTTELSERYFGETMLELLTRQAIRQLDVHWEARSDSEVRVAVDEFYGSLIAFYAAQGNRSAELLTRIDRLSYGQSYGRQNPLKMTDSEVIALLRKWTEEYADVEACAGVYAYLAEVYSDKKDFVRELEAAREGLKRYPRSVFASELKKREEAVLMPALSVQGRWAYPGEDCSLSVTSRNLKGVTLELYRLNIKPSSSVFANGTQGDVLIKKYGALAHRQHFTLPATPEYRDTVSVLTCRMPEAGIYVLKSVPDGHASRSEYEVIFLSPLQILGFPLPEGKTEYYVVDRRSGHPVPGAEIVFYTVSTPGEYKVYRSFCTDENGCVTVPKLAERMLWMNARRGDNDFMEVVYMSKPTLSAPGVAGKEANRMTLFTDRALYRPGQTVYVSGVAYRQTGDEVNVRDGYSAELILRDANSQEIARKRITTDDFGGFSAEFVLPQQLLPGDFRLSADGVTKYVRVEEYKRPTFDVVFNPYEKPYNMGDTLTLSGEAKNFSGVPVRQAKVKYTLTRSQAWFWNASAGGETLFTGETVTDADGRFSVRAVLQRPDREEDYGAGSFYLYKVTAEVTGAAGETQSGNLSLPVGRQSIGLQIKIRTMVAREKRESMQVQALNLNRRPVDAEVTLRVYEMADGEKGELKLTKAIAANKSFVPDELYGLASGAYRVEASAADEQGRISRAEQDFVLFSLSDTVPPVKTVDWLYQTVEGEGDDAPLVVYAGSSEPDLCLFYNIYSEGRRIHSERIVLNNEIRKFVYPYKEEYGDGMTVSFAFMRDDRLYTKQYYVERPAPRKELTLKWNVFRDRLTPGSEETWSLTVSNREGQPADARLLATLYDASLDRLLANEWNFGLNFYRYRTYANAGRLYTNSSVYLYTSFGSTREWAGVAGSHSLNSYSYLQLPSFTRYALPVYNGLMLRGAGSSRLVKNVMAKAAVTGAVAEAASDMQADAGFEVVENAVVSVAESAVAVETEPYVPLRENFAETAFFYPDLRTDSAGAAHIVFTVPDALTEWKFMGFAHTQGMDYGTITAKAKTSKPFMVQPNMPRFVRTGDRAVIAAVLNNLSTAAVSGTVRMQLLEPVAEKIIYETSQSFSVDEGESGAVNFAFDVDSRYEMLVCRITADAGNFSDGEQHYLPVLSDKQWVTETVPVQLNGEGTLTVATDELFNSQSKTATDRRLTVELTGTPDWYVVQALPVISNPTNEDALSWATAYYANKVAAAIVERNPQIKRQFDRWMAQGGTKETLLGSLEKNQDLKNLLLSETPWVAEAADETEQKHRIALLFDLNAMNSRLVQAVGKLKDLQNTDGSWSWYKGMAGSRIVTTQVVEMQARLKAMGIAADAQVNDRYVRAADYLKAMVKQECEEMRRREADGEKNVLPSDLAVRYLYICALDRYVMGKADAAVLSYLTQKLEGRSSQYTIYEKALAATVMQAVGKTREATGLIQSIREYTVYTAEMGRYFDTPKARYSWNSYRIPTQVAAMEAIYRIAPDERTLNEMKLWLLKQKQTQVWDTPIATADAVYAFLCMDGNRLAASGDRMTAVVGQTRLETSDEALGYIRRTYRGEETRIPEIRFEKSGDGIGWGAVYAQYLEEMDKVQSAKGRGVSIEREYLKDGRKVSARTVLNTGDRLTVRLTVKTDCDMDFIQIRDSRAACMEPTAQLSGYRMVNGVGCYQVSRDASTEFFIDKLRKGTYELEYTVYIDRSGTYQAGIATVQSAYAPEFGGYSKSEELVVNE